MNFQVTWRNPSIATQTSTSSFQYQVSRYHHHHRNLRHQKLFYQSNVSLMSACFLNIATALKGKEKRKKLRAHLAAVFLSSSNMERGEMHPTVSHGEILQEKFAPYMLSWLPLVPLGGCAWHSTANFWSLCSASASPPTIEAFAVAFPSCIFIEGQYHQCNQRWR